MVPLPTFLPCLEKLEPRQLLAISVESVLPLAASHQAPVTTDVAATFPSAINGSTVNPQKYVVHAGQTGRLLAADGAWSTSGGTITVDPAVNFHAGELIQATVTANVRSSAGVAAERYVWQFRTAVVGGSGVFGRAGVAYAVGNGDYSTAVSLGDLDGDGDLDAFVANYGPPDLGQSDNFGDANTVRLNNGSGNFSRGNFSDLPMGTIGLDNSYTHSKDVSLGDVDGDGDLDAFVVNEPGESHQVWLNNGSGNFVFRPVGDTGGSSSFESGGRDVELGDVDGDGDLDAFVVGFEGKYVWLNDGNGNFVDHAVGDNGGGVSNGQSNTFDSGSVDVELGDVDGDGDLDAFVANAWDPNRVWVNDGSGNFSDSGNRLGDSNSRGVSLGDVDGDGDLDAFVANSSGQANRVWLNNGSGAFSSGNSLGNASSHDVSLGDLDGDGDLDAFVANFGSPHISGMSASNDGAPNRVWLNDGSGNFAASTSNLGMGSSSSSSVSLGDLDGDGDLDAYVANWYGYYDDLSFTHIWPQHNQVRLNQNPQPQPDEIGVHRAIGNAGYFIEDISGNGAWDAEDQYFAFGHDTDTLNIGDWNGDGYDEIGVYRNIGGMGYFIQDFNGNGFWDGEDRYFTFGDGSDTPIIGDWNGDGRDEVGTHRNSGGVGYFIQDYNGTGAWDLGDRYFVFGDGSDTPVIGDWNGDGRDEIGTYREIGGFGYFIQDYNGSGAWDAGDRYFIFGDGSDNPISGDWNGDGYDQIGTHRNIGGLGYFIQDYNASGGWDAGDVYHRFGEGTDTPFIGNWRPSLPLMAASGRGPLAADAGALTADELAPVIAAAIDHWSIAAPLTADQEEVLRNVDVRVADLPGGRLGQASGNTITLDVNAAGYGWFVDDTPWDSSEFEPIDGTRDLTASAGSPAANRFDLVTAVTHELGHLLGFADDYSDIASDSLMNGWLGVGGRRSLTAGRQDRLYADTDWLGHPLS